MEEKVKIYLVHKLFDTTQLLIKSLTLIFILYIIYLCIVQLAGKTTIANFFIEYITSIKSGNLSWQLFTILLFIWGWAERYLRKDVIKRFHKSKENLEKIIDPQRSSSNLTETGETNPKDKL